MAIYGYHRTSTQEQHLDRGVKAIEDYCQENHLELDRLFTDQQTGKNFDRPDYKAMKDYVLKSGDTLIVSELDRLGRNKENTLKELRELKEKGIRLMILEIPTTLIDYTGQGDTLNTMIMETINNMLIEMYATFAHAEMEKRERRQKEGIESKKERGEWQDYGRPKKLDYKTFKAEYEKVLSGELRPFKCRDILGLTTATYYRYRKEYHQNEVALKETR